MRSATGQSRWAKSYSIVDHQILHGGYFQKLSHGALVLYLFLIVVGNKNGRSFYADRTVEEILRLTMPQLQHARSELCRSNLIDYCHPYWWVKNISNGHGPKLSHERSQRKNQVFERHPEALLSSDPTPVGHLAKESLQALFQNFREKNNEKENTP